MPAFDPGPPDRPGERREPLPGLLCKQHFVEAVADRGLSLGTAASLTLERACVVGDLETLGLSQCLADLLLAADDQRFMVALSAPYRRYRDHLASGRSDSRPQDLAGPVVVPLRLFPRVLDIDYEQALTAAALKEAIALELAALCVGRTMSEYALFFAASVAGY
jgi:hypothetical protein